MILIIKHIDIEGPGTLGDFLKEGSLKTKVVELGRGDKLPFLNECEAIVSLGGPMNVYEESKCPFLKDEDAFLRRAVVEGVPVLGICLGAQLLAKACGSIVMKAKEKEVGWLKVNLTEAGKRDPLFEGAPAELSVFQWHEDTFEIPKGAVHLAASQKCPNQAFRFGRNAYGLQFHLEITPEMVESWIRAYTKKKTPKTKEMITDSYRRKEAIKKQARGIYNSFLRIIATS